MGSWDRETDWNRDVLERIAALLFALAGLADLAAGAPFLRRRRVLGILSVGEAEARAFVIGMAYGAAVPTDVQESSGDAACLAVRLRALALLLCVLLAEAPSALGVAPAPRADPERPAGRAGRHAAPKAPDTS